MHAYRPNHYEALGVSRSADAEAIRTAWRAHAKQLHPDLSEGQSKEAFLRLQEAYDVLRDPERRAHYDDTLRQATRRPLRPQTTAGAAPRTFPRAPTAPRRRIPSRTPGLRGFLAAIGLVVIVTAGIAGWQVFFVPEPEPTTMIVKVDRDNRAPKLPADPGILTREVDRAVQAQIERVEAAKKRMAEQLSELDAHKPAPNAAAPGTTTPAMLAARVECIGRGTNIVLTREHDVARVSYDNGPSVQPRISDLGTGTVLVSRIEPTNKIAIGFTKGDRSGTTLLMFDEVGRVRQTFPIECTVAAF